MSQLGILSPSALFHAPPACLASTFTLYEVQFSALEGKGREDGAQ
jgi:hypothetical protein